MPSLLHDLQNPDRLPDPSQDVQVVQTHISIVFVADTFVYKVKKPVNFGFLDFSTLEKRHHFCGREIELNRRLSKDIYLDVLPVVFDGKSHSIGEGPGEIVEYAVKMKRIPDDKLMKSIFDKDDLSSDHLERIAHMLADFHSKAHRDSDIDRFGEPEKFRINTDENFEQVKKYIGKTIGEDQFQGLKRWTNDFYKSNRNLFDRRIKLGRIRDCHGDLHMEHVCFLDNVSAIDCIEFNDRFRYGDVLADIAFLLMDLEYRGGKDLADILWQKYSSVAGEGNADVLLTFYKVYRAFVRGKVTSFQIDDESISADKKEEAVKTAEKYFDLAYSYISA
ncbi:phosphotransferase [Thermodesulfobacteriota bacterium]